jgi:putative PIN family toxin of toxin-antitoxin system
MTVVLDSNIWISLVLNEQLDFIAAFQKKGNQIISCKNLLNEVTNVLLRPKFKKRFANNYIEAFIQFHQLITTAIEPTNIESIVTDPKDDYLFALSKISKADYFVTGDKLLLMVKPISLNPRYNAG